MAVSIEVHKLIDQILSRQCDSACLAKWLAENSFQVFESSNEQDRMVIADLDAALSGIQRGAQREGFLVDTAEELARCLNLSLDLPDSKVILDLPYD